MMSQDPVAMSNASNDGFVTSYSQAVYSHLPFSSKVEFKCKNNWIRLLNQSGCVQRQRGAAQDINDVNTDYDAEQ